MYGKLVFVALFVVALWQLPGTSSSNGNGAPVGTCVSGSHYVDSAGGDVWTCKGSAWMKQGGSVIAKGTINLSAITIPAVSCTNYIVGWSAPGALVSDLASGSYQVQPPGQDGFLVFNWFLKPNTLYLTICNPTSASLTVTSTPINWRVIR